MYYYGIRLSFFLVEVILQLLLMACQIRMTMDHLQTLCDHLACIIDPDHIYHSVMP